VRANACKFRRNPLHNLPCLLRLAVSSCGAAARKPAAGQLCLLDRRRQGVKKSGQAAGSCSCCCHRRAAADAAAPAAAASPLLLLLQPQLKKDTETTSPASSHTTVGRWQQSQAQPQGHTTPRKTTRCTATTSMKLVERRALSHAWPTWPTMHATAGWMLRHSRAAKAAACLLERVPMVL
jgi:hypothetical protein